MRGARRAQLRGVPGRAQGHVRAHERAAGLRVHHQQARGGPWLLTSLPCQGKIAMLCHHACGRAHVIKAVRAQHCTCLTSVRWCDDWFALCRGSCRRCVSVDSSCVDNSRATTDDECLTSRSCDQVRPANFLHVARAQELPGPHGPQGRAGVPGIAVHCGRLRAGRARRGPARLWRIGARARAAAVAAEHRTGLEPGDEPGSLEHESMGRVRCLVVQPVKVPFWAEQ